MAAKLKTADMNCFGKSAAPNKKIIVFKRNFIWQCLRNMYQITNSGLNFALAYNITAGDGGGGGMSQRSVWYIGMTQLSQQLVSTVCHLCCNNT